MNPLMFLILCDPGCLGDCFGIFEVARAQPETLGLNAGTAAREALRNRPAGKPLSA